MSEPIDLAATWREVKDEVFCARCGNDGNHWELIDGVPVCVHCLQDEARRLADI